MQNCEIPIVRGLIKGIKEINQIVKKVTDEYYLTYEGYIIFDKKSISINKGNHYGKVNEFNKFPLPMQSDLLLRIYSVALFNVIKDNLTKITNIFIDDMNVIIMKDNEYYTIGRYINSDELNDDIVSNQNLTVDILKKTLPISLHHESCPNLIANMVMMVEEDDYSIKITKELVPEIKKSSTIDIGFFDVDMDTDGDGEIFETLIKTYTDNINIIHSYLCIKY